MSKEKKQSFMGGAAILASAVVVVKLIGAVYKLPLNNILGDVGKTYFDTAYLYHAGESEHAARDALVGRHPRDSFTLADKMPLFHFKPEDGPDKQAQVFAHQLEKCGVDCFDYYLLHCVDRKSYEIAKRLDTFGFLR